MLKKVNFNYFFQLLLYFLKNTNSTKKSRIFGLVDLGNQVRFFASFPHHKPKRLV